MPSGGTAGQRGYFHDNFQMELIGANYPSAETQAESLFTLALEIVDNPDFDPTLQAGDENKRYMLNLQLQWSRDNSEIVRYSFYFNDTESMADWNLYLLYQAMANAPMPEEEEPEPVVITAPVDDRWRNQTLYVNVGAGLDLGFFIYPASGDVETGIIMPTLIAGAEYHFLDYLSAELDLKPRFMKDLGLTAAAALTAKGVFKFASVMLEPYLGLEYALDITAKVPPLSILGGLQVGIRGAPQSAWVLDVGVTQSILGTFHAENTLDYSLMRFHVLAGFKFGFFDRKTTN
jgi:hypothetical protein